MKLLNIIKINFKKLAKSRPEFMSFMEKNGFIAQVHYTNCNASLLYEQRF